MALHNIAAGGGSGGGTASSLVTTGTSLFLTESDNSDFGSGVAVIKDEVNTADNSINGSSMLAFPGSLSIYGDTGADGMGYWSLGLSGNRRFGWSMDHWSEFSNDTASLKVVSSESGMVNDGIQISSTSGRIATLRTTNLTNGAQAFEFPAAGGTIATEEYIADNTPSLGSTGSDIEITDPTKGIILRSPNGSRFRVTVDNTGTLVTTEVI